MAAPAPTCPTCRGALEWLPQGLWGCPRCRVTYPASPPAAGPAAAAPHAPGAAAAKKKLIIGLGAGAAVAGVAVAVLLITGGGGGQGSPEALAQAAVDAAAHGDVDGLYALTGGTGLKHEVLDCESGKGYGDRDERDEREIRDTLKRRATSWKGIDAKVVRVKLDDAPEELAVGKHLGDCTVKIAAKLYEADVHVRYAVKGDPPATRSKRMTAIDVGGTWYLILPPRGPYDADGELDDSGDIVDDADDSGASGGGDDGDSDKAALTRMRDRMCACTDAACVEAAQRDMAPLMKRLGEKYQDSSKPPKALMDIAMQMTECMSKAMQAGSGTP